MTTIRRIVYNKNEKNTNNTSNSTINQASTTINSIIILKSNNDKMPVEVGAKPPHSPSKLNPVLGKDPMTF